MHLLVPILVGLMVLPASVMAPVALAEVKAPEVIAEAPSVLKSPEVALAPLTTKLTAYNAVPGQTDNDPFTTASGAFSNPEVVAARSSDLAHQLPYGTVIAIGRTYADTPACGYSKVEEQIGYRVIADAMNPRITNTVDVLFDHTRVVPVGARMINPGYALGRCGEVTVTVVGFLNLKDIPATQTELAALVDGPATSATEFAKR